MSFHPGVPHPRGNSKGTGKTLNDACSLYNQYLPPTPDIPLKILTFCLIQKPPFAQMALIRCSILPKSSFMSFFLKVSLFSSSIHLQSSAVWLPARPSAKAIVLKNTLPYCLAQLTLLSPYYIPLLYLAVLIGSLLFQTVLP